MNKIKALSDITISQIAAGEIIENPASVCKELVENSIDAGAKKILIQLGDTLTDFIRITDDGHGISKEDLPIAFKRHATSKLEKIQDLDNLLSLGFRGEALASIANISQVEIISKTKDSNIGNKAIVNGGNIKEIIPIGAADGTSILVKNLFYNTPVRKKYLKSIRMELDNIVSIIESIALGHNDISFHLTHKSKTILQSHPSSNKINHLYSILGKEIVTNLIPIYFDSESYKIEGFISNNNLHRSSPQKEYLYINGRNVRNREISKSIRTIYHTLIPLQRYPVFILYIDMDPMLIDVNIHPQKQYVRISNENYIVNILEKLIRAKLMPNRKILDIQLDTPDENKKVNILENKTIFDLAKEKTSDYSYELEANTTELTKEENLFDKVDIVNDIFPEAISENKILTNEEIDKNLLNENQLDYSKILDYDKKKERINIDLNLEYLDYIGVLFKTYLLFENKRDLSLLLLDQHAVHERILFEKFYTQLKNDSIHQQILLEPLIIQLSPNEMMKLHRHLDEFKFLGFSIESFGDKSLILREVPTHVLISSYENFIRDSLYELDDGKDIVEQNIYKVMRMACRKAIKAGDQIDMMQANALVTDLLGCNNPYTCPHGRPTILSMSKRMIEKMFLREG